MKCSNEMAFEFFFMFLLYQPKRKRGLRVAQNRNNFIARKKVFPKKEMKKGFGKTAICQHEHLRDSEYAPKLSQTADCDFQL